ncbi:hypothetical protein Pcinc_007366 [Petrolisthes cinctipes]|uniref:Gag-pol polyprotein n=1 Tax=Petrolisthes cinctipes TaxID=88211 RepID=A0AAE1GB26_PETCI|nr:hypothetical protein Pcinc_007366 [Petrolisthes cinctipes]
MCLRECQTLALRVLTHPPISVPVSYIKDPLSRTSFVIDTGAKSIDRKHLSALTLKAANATTIKTYGSTRLAVSLGLRRKFNWSFILADVENAIIGCDFLSHFDLSVRLRCCQIVDNSTNLAMQGVEVLSSAGLDSARLKIVKDDFQYMLDQGIIRQNTDKDFSTPMMVHIRYLKCNGIRWTPLHLSPRNTIPVLAESASHQFDSSRNLGEGPIAVHAARANNLFVLNCRGRDSSDLQQYSRPRGSSHTQPMTEQHVVNMAELHVITRGIKTPVAVHSSVRVPGFTSLG